jgi:hypothetical protein
MSDVELNLKVRSHRNSTFVWTDFFLSLAKKPLFLEGKKLAFAILDKRIIGNKIALI